MAIQGLVLLIKILSGLFVSILLMRFYLYMARAPFKHPLTQFCVKLTDFIVRPVKKIIPSVRDFDNASLLLAWLVSLLALVLMLLISPLPYDFAAAENWLLLAFMAILEVINRSLNLLVVAVLVQALLSWLQPYNPLTPVIELLTRPFLKHFRWARIGNIDLAPLVLLIVVQVLLTFPLAILENQLSAQLSLAV